MVPLGTTWALLLTLIVPSTIMRGRVVLLATRRYELPPSVRLPVMYTSPLTVMSHEPVTLTSPVILRFAGQLRTKPFGLFHVLHPFTDVSVLGKVVVIAAICPARS